MLLVDISSRHWLRLCIKPLCIQFVRLATLDTLIWHYTIITFLRFATLDTLIWHYTFIRHSCLKSIVFFFYY